MSRVRGLIDAVLRVFFGHNMVDGASDWYEARRKSKTSRDEVERIIKESEDSFR